MIYYFMFEAEMRRDRSKRSFVEGAFINCWVKSTDERKALYQATSYIEIQGWKLVNVEEKFEAKRERYENDAELKESLECFDQAVKDGISAIFHTWIDEDE